MKVAKSVFIWLVVIAVICVIVKFQRLFWIGLLVLLMLPILAQLFVLVVSVADRAWKAVFERPPPP